MIECGTFISGRSCTAQEIAAIIAAVVVLLGVISTTILGAPNMAGK
jgi:hypothetical protein